MTKLVVLKQNESTSSITALTVSAKKDAPATSAYWHAEADFCNAGGQHLYLISDCNNSMYEHSRPDVFRNTAGTLFDIDGLKGITPIDGAIVTVKRWKYGMQSGGRHMSPRNEGILYVDVQTSGVMIDGHVFMKKLSFKLCVTGGCGEQSSLNALVNVASKKLCGAIESYLKKISTPECA